MPGNTIVELDSDGFGGVDHGGTVDDDVLDLRRKTHSSTRGREAEQDEGRAYGIRRGTASKTTDTQPMRPTAGDLRYSSKARSRLERNTIILVCNLRVRNSHKRRRADVEPVRILRYSPVLGGGGHDEVVVHDVAGSTGDGVEDVRRVLESEVVDSDVLGVVDVHQSGAFIRVVCCKFWKDE